MLVHAAGGALAHRLLKSVCAAELRAVVLGWKALIEGVVCRGETFASSFFLF